MYVLKVKPKICAPHSSQTDKARNTKIGMEHLGPTLTPLQNLVTIGSRGPVHQNPQFMSISVFFFFFFFSAFFDRATAQTAEPIFMVDGSNDVFSRKEVPFGVHMIT
jgi:hypothetical protein